MADAIRDAINAVRSVLALRLMWLAVLVAPEDERASVSLALGAHILNVGGADLVQEVQRRHQLDPTFLGQ